MAWQRHDYAAAHTMVVCVAATAVLASVLWVFGILYFNFLAALMVTLLVEHLVLTFYRKPSTIDRIFTRRTDSTRCDIFYFLFSSSDTPGAFVKFTYPGVIYLLMTKLNIPTIALLPHSKLLPQDPLLLAILGFVLIDFQRYVSHVLLHKVPFLWRMHKLHHAGTDFNILLYFRFSLAESAFQSITSFLILTVLFGRLPGAGEFFVITTGRYFLDFLSHSDVPWDYGWIGYVFSSPRYHRMHHSRQREDHDSNYGEIFAFWDFLFSTVNWRYCADPSVADRVEIGLENGEDANINAHRLRCLVEGTWLPVAWRVVAGGRRLGQRALRNGTGR